MASFAVPNSYASLSVIFLLFFCVTMLAMHVAADEEAPIFFIFGDSTADVGTNNFIVNTIAKANFRYNGIDYPYSVPTGRFSNGFNTADQIARLFGHKKSPPPFLALEQRQFSFKKNILKGVNFASAGSGILRETGRKKWGEVIYLQKQVEQFELVRGNITEALGPEIAARFVSKALFLISIGSNDLFDYISGEIGINFRNDVEFMAFLQLSYYVHIRKLYDLGARKFGIVSVPPIGCCPGAMAQNLANGGGSGCVEELNTLARAFFSETESLLRRLSSELKGIKFSLGNSFAMTTNIIQDPLVFGLKEIKTACCGHGNFSGEGPCFEGTGTKLCGDRRDHLFWDWFHPTNKVSELAALTFFGGESQLVIPMNFSQLALIQLHD